VLTEECTIVTLGVKNLDVQVQLSEGMLPKALFATSLLKPREYEELCEQHAPALSKKLAVVSVRKIYRQSPFGLGSRVPLL